MQLRTVLRATKHRMAIAESLLPKALVPLVQQMARPPTVEEMTLFAGTPSAAKLLREIEHRTKKALAHAHPDLTR